jgi:23S rRNA pseudouridine2605 synthase
MSPAGRPPRRRAQRPPGGQQPGGQQPGGQQPGGQQYGGQPGKAQDLTRGQAELMARLADDDPDDDDWGDEDEDQRDSLIDVPGGVRLQKVLAAAGIGSRRHCEQLIADGRVEVDDEIVRRFGARVDPQHQVIRVDGRRIPAREDLVYIALNKPAGVLTTMSDSRGRATMADLLGDVSERLYHVGRLDYDTEGLMLLMNDGELAHRLAHPRFGVPKTYLAEVSGPVPRDLARQLIGGIELEDGVASADKFRVVERLGTRALVEITLHEGRKHIVKRMLAAAGHPVSRLVRTHVGPIALGPLRPGTTRHLSVKEVGDLYAAVGL